VEKVDRKQDTGLRSGREIFTLSGRDYISHYQIRRGTFLLAVVILALFIGVILLELPARAAFVATGVLIFSTVLAVYPYVGLFAQIYLYFRPFPVWGGPEFLRPIFLVTIITMAFFVVNFIFIKKKKFRLPLEGKLALLLLAFLVLSSFFAVHSREISFSQNVIFLKIIIFYILLVNLITTKKELNGVVWLIIACCALASFEAIRLYRYYGWARVDSVGGTHREANYLAATLVLALPLVYQKMNSPRLYEKLIAIALLPASMVGVVLTGSRSGTLGLLAVLLLLFWKFRRKGLSTVILIFLILATVVAAPAHYWTRTKTISDYEDDRAAQSRLELWEAGLRIYLDHPVAGVGQGNFAWISPEYTNNYFRSWTGEGFVAHNIFIQFLAESGLQALIVFLALVVVTFRGLNRARRKLQALGGQEDLQDLGSAVTIGLIGFLVCGFFLSSAHLDILYWFLAMGPVIGSLADKMTAEYARGQSKEDSKGGQTTALMLPS